MEYEKLLQKVYEVEQAIEMYQASIKKSVLLAHAYDKPPKRRVTKYNIKRKKILSSSPQKSPKATQNEKALYISIKIKHLKERLSLLPPGAPCTRCNGSGVEPLCN